MNAARALGVLISTGGFASPASAAPLTDFNIPRAPLEQALISTAVQGHFALGGLDPKLCGKAKVSLKGQMRNDTALANLTRHSACDIENLGHETYRLILRKAPTSKSSPPVEVSAAPEFVTVTANRRPQLLGDAPSAISILRPSDLSGHEGGLSEVAGRVAGFTTTNLGPGRDKIMLRGLSDGVFTGRTQSMVGLYLDDTPLTYNAPDPDLLLTDLARIEVLKGPQGALYGEGSIAGVVRLVTQKPDLSRKAAFWRTSLGLPVKGNLSSRFEAMLNLPIIADKAGLRLVIYDDAAGGYLNDLALKARNTNPTHRFGGRLGFDWRIGEQWRVSTSATVQEINTRNSQYVTGSEGAYNRRVGVLEPHDNDFNQIAGRIAGPTRWGDLSLSINHLHHHIVSAYDASPLLKTLPAVQQTGTLTYTEAQDVELTTVEWLFVSPSDQPVRWLGGFYSASGTESFRPALIYVASGKSLYAEARKDEISALAAFGELSFDLRPHWTLTLGARYSDDQHDVQSQITRPIAGGSNVADGVERQSSDRHLAHKFGLRYQPNADFLVYVQSAEGYRGGGVNTSRLDVNDPIATQYRGDELNSYEAGLKTRLDDDRLNLTLSLFKVYWDRIQSDQFQSTGLPMTVNIGNGVNQGFEVEADWHLSDNFSLHGAAIFNEPRLTHPDPAYTTAEDSGLPNIARQSLHLSARAHMNALGGDWTHEASISYQGRSRLNFGPLQTLSMGDYATFNLSTSYERGAWHLSANVQSSVPGNANSLAYGNPFTIALAPQRTPLRPATLGLSLTRNY